MGYEGMPRRYQVYPDVFQVYHVISSAGALILSVAYLFPLFYLPWSLRHGERAGANPWGATGLEWTTLSPPPKDNFARIPCVTTEPYAYHPDNDPGTVAIRSQSGEGVSG
jgi:cytochrome c oxidase subunit 1